MLNSKRFRSAFLMAISLVMLSSCTERKQHPVVVPLQGVVERIDLEERVVHVRYHNPKHNRDEVWPIHISGETELLINDVLARPEDARRGESATGTVRIERRGRNERWLTALRVRIERIPSPDDLSAGPDSQPSDSQ